MSKPKTVDDWGISRKLDEKCINVIVTRGVCDSDCTFLVQTDSVLLYMI